jgi:diaminopimelate epimerase
MLIEFHKYHGCGNDFILIDNREKHFPSKDHRLIKELCMRHTGIGADGLILLNPSLHADFAMQYFNADGKEGTMCGNGGRCIIQFAHDLDIISGKSIFEAIDGYHEADLIEEQYVKLKMQDCKHIEIKKNYYLIHTGSPHYVTFVHDCNAIDVLDSGKNIRYDKSISLEGVNVNFVQILRNDQILMRTYERGVENETLSCGTGAVASAIATFLHTQTNTESYLCEIHSQGGILEVHFISPDDHTFQDIYLAGPAEHVFSGEIDTDKTVY